MAVRPNGQALDIAFLGLGQAGGNLATEALRLGYRAMAVNTAHTDLEALHPTGGCPGLPEETHIYVGIDGYDGAGSDPDYGRECLLEHADTIRSAVAEQLGDADVLILGAGLGGGTGSSISTLIGILKEHAPPLLPFLTLPAESESALAKLNAVRAAKEVLDTEVSGWVFIDNERLNEHHPSVSVASYYPKVNRHILEPLDALNRLNHRVGYRPVRSFDGEDFRKLLLSGGIINFAETQLDTVDADHISKAYLDSLRQNPQMPRDYDPRSTSYIGLILEAPLSLLDQVSMSELENLSQVIKSETAGAVIHPGIYRTPDDRPPMLRTLSCTTTVPQGLRELLETAEAEGQWLGQKVTDAASSLDLGDIADVELFRQRPRPSRRLPNPPSDAHRHRFAHTPARRRAAQPRTAPLSPGDATATLADAITSPHPAEPASPGSASHSENRPARRPMTEVPPRLDPTTYDSWGVEYSDHEASKIRSEASDTSALIPALRGETPDFSEGPIGSPPGESPMVEPDTTGPRDALLEEPPAPVQPLLRGDISDELTTHSLTSSAARWPSSPPAASDHPASGNVPDPTEYERLVDAFRQATQEDDRRAQQAIADRLTREARSDITVVRYYAVDAMARARADIFQPALTRARQDGHAAIREIAHSALRAPESVFED